MNIAPKIVKINMQRQALKREVVLPPNGYNQPFGAMDRAGGTEPLSSYQNVQATEQDDIAAAMWRSVDGNDINEIDSPQLTGGNPVADLSAPIV